MSKGEQQTSAASHGIGSPAGQSALKASSSLGSSACWKSWPSSSGWPAASNVAHALAKRMQNCFSALWRDSYGRVLGQTHWTLSGVSPQPVAVLPLARRTVRRTRAQVTLVRVSAPNLSGTRVSTGRKNSSPAATRISVGLAINGGCDRRRGGVLSAWRRPVFSFYPSRGCPTGRLG